MEYETSKALGVDEGWAWFWQQAIRSCKPWLKEARPTPLETGTANQQLWNDAKE